MKFAVIEPQVRNVGVLYTDLLRLEADLSGGIFNSQEDANEWNDREYDGDAAVICFADEYLDGTPPQQMTLPTKDNLPDEDTEFWVEVNVTQGTSMSIHPDFIREDETLEEHIETFLKEEYLGQLAADIADGIRENQISIASIKHADDY